MAAPSPVPALFSRGSLLSLLMRHHAWTRPLLSHSPSPCSQPLGSHRGREGEGWGRMVPPAEPRNPQLAPRNAVQINLSHSGVQCLIQTGVPLHKLPNRGCFGGDNAALSLLGGHQCSGELFLWPFLSVWCRHESIRVTLHYPVLTGREELGT